MSTEPEQPSLVINVGHTNTTAVLVAEDRTHVIFEPASGAQVWPSVVYFDGVQMLVGTPALERRAADPASAATGFGRSLATDQVTVVAGRPLRASEFVAALLSSLRREAEQVAGRQVHRVLLTAPVGDGSQEARRRAMLAAAEAAGFTEVEVLNEPVATAHALVPGGDLAAGDLVLVYGLGGGSFDATLVRLDWPVSQIVGQVRLSDCGASDIDTMLSRHIIESNRSWLAPPAGDEDVALRLAAAVTDFAQRLRHRLSHFAEAEDFLLPSAPAYRLTRPELAALAAPVLHRTVLTCRQLLARHDVPSRQLAAILLMGGGSRMSVVVDLLANEFGRPLLRVDDSELAAVRGAARWLQASGPRLVQAVAGPGRLTPLACTVPGGTARLERWLITPGQAYVSGQPIGRLRLPGGALWDVTAAVGGRLDRTLAAPGTEVADGQWLALIRE